MSWNPFADRSPPPPARAPEGALVFALGDVHGQADLLYALLRYVVAAGRGRPQKPILVGLGDYIDRGAYSRHVLDLLISAQGYEGVETHFLLGNHEEAMLDFLDGRSDGGAWLAFGGVDTLAAFGVEPAASGDPAEVQAMRAALAPALGEARIGFLDALETRFICGDYFFAHAGAAPGVALGAQSAHDLIWIRDRFLKDRRRFDKIVVHGHSPTVEVHADHRRIGIDTGAYVTGVLTLLRLEGEGRSLVQAVRQSGGDVVIRELAL